MALVVLASASILGHVAIGRVATDIEAIGSRIQEFERSNERLPATLDELGEGTQVDRWGNPYQYLPSTAQDWSSQRRRDRFVVPLNSEFDLYSLGPDGETRPPLTAWPSWDDIVWANDGLYVGPANKF